jgi:60 kDa SS-A/Ro ribonucleoprotein
MFYDDIGKGNPSIGDIIKMVHARPSNEVQSNMFKYVLGREFTTKLLPPVVASFECFKKDSSGEVPAVDFRVFM